MSVDRWWQTLRPFLGRAPTRADISGYVDAQMLRDGEQCAVSPRGNKVQAGRLVDVHTSNVRVYCPAKNRSDCCELLHKL